MCKTRCDCHKHWVIFINYYYNDILKIIHLPFTICLMWDRGRSSFLTSTNVPGPDALIYAEKDKMEKANKTRRQGLENCFFFLG